jgi:hypothetical protein
MASFIYLYSKFTEELLLLSAAGIFTLLSIYCYTWVVKKRRLGAARNQIPAGMVKVYLNQLINEAQFVRTQLFGLAGGVAPSPENFAAHFQAASPTAAHPLANPSATPAFTGGEIPSDLLERLKALENQLAEKESMVVNINVEKTKLLEEVENLKQNEKVVGSSAAANGNNDDLLQKMKALEERLEEYALFEDDLANLKRLQQENAQLKKQVDQGGKPASTPVPPPAEREEPVVETASAASSTKPVLDQSAIDALLDGHSAIPPTPQAEAPVENSAKAQASESQEPQIEPTPINALSAKSQTAKDEEAAAETATAEAAVADARKNAEAKAAKAKAAPEASPVKSSGDEFENLVDSVESSLTAKSPAEVAATSTAEAAPTAEMAAPAQASATSSSEKTDEELLKEFENLLNS